MTVEVGGLERRSQETDCLELALNSPRIRRGYETYPDAENLKNEGQGSVNGRGCHSRRGWHSHAAETQKNGLREEASKEETSPVSQDLCHSMGEWNKLPQGKAKEETVSVGVLVTVATQQSPQTQKLKITPIYHPTVLVRQLQPGLPGSSAQGLTDLPAGCWLDYHLDA